MKNKVQRNRGKMKIPFKTYPSTFCTYRVKDRIAAKFREMAGYVDLAAMTGKGLIGPGNFSQDFEVAQGFT